jgi:hypothetical protein
MILTIIIIRLKVLSCGVCHTESDEIEGRTLTEFLPLAAQIPLRPEIQTYTPVKHSLFKIISILRHITIINPRGRFDATISPSLRGFGGGTG